LVSSVLFYQLNAEIIADLDDYAGSRVIEALEGEVKKMITFPEYNENDLLVVEKAPDSPARSPSSLFYSAAESDLIIPVAENKEEVSAQIQC